LILVITFFLIGFVQNILIFAIFMIVVSYGVSISRGLLMSKITQTVSPKEMGKINGYTTTLDSLAQIFGPIVGTFILTVYQPFWLGILMSVLALVAFLMIFHKIRPYYAKEHHEKLDRVLTHL
ncbi:MAG: MFS transporter, partial [Promethearchaeota archaeon]